MALDSTIEVLGHANLKQIAENGAWTNAQKQTAYAAHTARNDQFAELAYQNAISNQQLATQAALDHQNELRSINKMFLGALANKFINQDVEQAISDAQIMKGNSDSSILSILSSLGGGQIAGKIAQTTPPETGVATGLAQLNALSNQNLTTASIMASVAQVLAKVAQTTPPETGKA